jgi:DNA-binding response OmpR family regulator
MKVLVVEDDPLIRQALKEILQGEGYLVSEAADGDAGLQAFARWRPDFVCLDIMMPRRNGFEVCKEIRKSDARVPIIFISAKGEEIDKVLGLELGADDFIVKPFGIREVVARVRAVTRRCLAVAPEGPVGGTAAPSGGGTPAANGDPATWPPSFHLGDLTVLPRELRARRGEQVIELSLREVRLLKLFSDRPGEVLDRMVLFRAGWDEEHLPTSRTLDQHISQLRKRIEPDPKNPRLIATVHGVGYRHDP